MTYYLFFRLLLNSECYGGQIMAEYITTTKILFIKNFLW